MTQREEDQFIPVIGLEVHIQLQTQTKIFASDSTAFGSAPNTNISVITLGHPGVMPRLNKKVVEYAVKMGLACGSEISRQQIFDRKNYFYPDLPKGYQITQDKTPVCIGGSIRIPMEGETGRRIRLNRIHMEEDAGKSMHMPEGESQVDLNRAGVPLIELVTEPDIHNAEEAGLLLSEIHKMVRYLEICDGNMEEGSLRCDANVSVMRKNDNEYGRKVEIKNLNSFRNVQKAIEYEISRQVAVLKNGGSIISETRTFEAASGKTFGMRTKEELNDYRYFPDPDLSPFEISENWLYEIGQSMPELPDELRTRMVHEMGLPLYDANILIESRELADYFFTACESAPNYKSVSNWIMGPVKSYLNENQVEIAGFPISANQLGELVNLIDSGKIPHATASREIFPALLKSPGLDIQAIITDKNLDASLDESRLKDIVDEVISSLPDKVEAYRNGKKGLIGMFIGEVMKKTKGQADPKIVTALIRESLQ